MGAHDALLQLLVGVEPPLRVGPTRMGSQCVKQINELRLPHPQPNPGSAPVTTRFNIQNHQKTTNKKWSYTHNRQILH